MKITESVSVADERGENSRTDATGSGLSRRQALGAIASAAWAIGIAGNLAVSGLARAGTTADPGAKQAFIDDLIARMTVDEKVGQLRLISIGPEMPIAKLEEEIAAGRIGASVKTVVRRDNRPLQEAAVQRSRLKIPLFFAYDVVHGHRTTFPIPLCLASSFDRAAIEHMVRVSAV